MFAHSRFWSVASFAAPKRRRAARRKPPAATLARVVEDDVWRALLLRCNHTRSLIVLSGVNKALRALVRHNHALLRYLFEKHFNWNPSAHRTIASKHTPDALVAAHDREWEPQAHWRGPRGVVPREHRERFDRYVWRALVQASAPWCSVCHAPVEGCANVWTMSLRVCAACLPGRFISHRELWREHNVWVGSGLKRRRTVMGVLQGAAYSVMDESTPMARAALTTSVHDLRGVPGVGRGGGTAKTYLFWRAHIPRVLRLDKARAMRGAMQQAVDVLGGYAQRWIVQYVIRKGLVRGAPERLRKRYIAKWTQAPSEYLDHTLGGAMHHRTMEAVRRNPLWTGPTDRAWARITVQGVELVEDA